MVCWNFSERLNLTRFQVVAELIEATYAVKSVPFFNSEIKLAEVGIEFDKEPHIPEPIICPPHNFTCGTVDISGKCNYAITNITKCKEGILF